MFELSSEEVMCALFVTPGPQELDATVLDLCHMESVLYQITVPVYVIYTVICLQVRYLGSNWQAATSAAVNLVATAWIIKASVVLSTMLSITH